jgi:hypothetical protein
MGSKAGQQSETSQERAQAQHALALMQDYKQRWLPLQTQLAKTIEQEGEAGSSARKLAAGKASTDTAMAFDKAGTQLEKGLSDSGAMPGSSRANLAVTGLGTDAAASTGLGHMMSEQAVDDAYTQGLGALTSLGRGEKAMVGNSLTQQAQQSASQAAADAKVSLMNRQGDAAAGGQLLGFGIQQGATKFGSGVNGFAAMDPYGMGTNNTGTSLPTAGGQ